MTASIATSYNMDYVTVNGRNVTLAGKITKIEQVKRGKYQGVANGLPFTIYGGKVMGGARNEWFLDWDCYTGVLCTSAADAIRLIEAS